MSKTSRGDLPDSTNNHKETITQKEKANIRAKKWFLANRERRKKYINDWNKKNNDKVRLYQWRYRRNLRHTAIEYYSGGDNKCACCDEGIWEFLSIDHIHGDGNKHRKSIKVSGGHNFYQWLKSNNYPKGYRVLCYNCNFSLGMWNYCPHNE